MGRPPIRKKDAFTAAERQRRRRSRLRREAKAAELVLIREKNAKRYARYARANPLEWTRVGTIRKDGPSIFREVGRRRSDLDDEDILAMLEQITELARERGLI
jgi:hypothetical protein